MYWLTYSLYHPRGVLKITDCVGKLYHRPYSLYQITSEMPQFLVQLIRITWICEMAAWWFAIVILLARNLFFLNINCDTFCLTILTIFMKSSVNKCRLFYFWNLCVNCDAYNRHCQHATKAKSCLNFCFVFISDIHVKKTWDFKGLESISQKIIPHNWVHNCW